jgi:hypothetical protein
MATRATRSPRRPPLAELPDEATLAELKLSPEVAWYLVRPRTSRCRSAWQVPVWKTPEPRDLDGAVFDPARVDRVLAAFGRLRHTQGRWAGKPLTPANWQVAYILAPVFGWVRPDDEAGGLVRVIRTAHVDEPRKNGKTTLAGGLGMYLTAADGEQGAQVLAVAASKEQAGFCFNPVKAIAEKSPDLAPYVKPLASKIVHPASGSYFQVVASVGDLLHGANVHGAVVDELHIHKTRDVVDAVETGTGARSQPLIVFITTADEGKPGTIYAEKREYLEKLARGVFVDHTFYGVVWAAAESERDLTERGLSPFSEEAQRQANPGYGVSPTAAFLGRGGVGEGVPGEAGPVSAAASGDPHEAGHPVHPAGRLGCVRRRRRRGGAGRPAVPRRPGHGFGLGPDRAVLGLPGPSGGHVHGAVAVLAAGGCPGGPGPAYGRLRAGVGPGRLDPDDARRGVRPVRGQRPARQDAQTFACRPSATTGGARTT